MATNKSTVKTDKNTNSTLAAALDGVHPDIGTWIKRSLLVLIALLALFLVIARVRATREAKAAQAYATLAKAVTAEDFDRVAAEYSGTVVGRQAQLSAAQELFNQGNYPLAAERFAAAASGDDAIALRATLGQALVCEALGQSDPAQIAKALQLFAEVGGKAASLSLAGIQVDALLGQVRCYRLNGDLAKAKELVEAAKKLTENLAKTDPATSQPLSQCIGVAADSLAAYELATAAPAPAPAAAPTPEEGAAVQPAAQPAN